MRSNITLSILLVGMLFLTAGVTLSAPQTHVYSFESGTHQSWLGVQLQDVTKKLKEEKSLSVDKGAYVTDVVEESPAEKAGLKEGDVIVKFDGKDVGESDDLIEAVRKTKRDAEVKIEIVRNNERKTLTATIDRAPRSYSYNFRMPPMPRMPQMPRLPRMWHGPHHSSSFSTSSDRMNGLELQDLTRQLAEYFEVPDRHGVLVVDVEKGSEGEKAGFKAGDVIVKLDGENVRDVGDVSESIHGAKKNSELPCDIVRKGKSVSLKWHVSRYDDDEEGDDDTSLNMIAPSAHTGCEAKLDRIQQFKEDIYRLKNTLRERFREMGSLISERISEIIQAVSNS